MGKVRVSTIGLEEAEEKQKEKTANRKEAKKTAKETKEPRPKADQPMAEETVAVLSPTEKKEAKPEKKEGKKSTEATTPTHQRSKKYQSVVKLIEKNKMYSLSEGIKLLSQAHIAKFDETVELHINTNAPGVSGSISLPHGTGKKVKVAIISPSHDAKTAEELLKQIENGTIAFDILIATPDAMPRLAKVARILGPRGLMPNPKNGTITQKPEELAKKYEKGQLTFKTESKAPVIHLSVGKLSFGQDKLTENISAALAAVQTKNIKNVTLKSTISPGIKIQVS